MIILPISPTYIILSINQFLYRSNSHNVHLYYFLSHFTVNNLVLHIIRDRANQNKLINFRIYI